MVLYGKTRNSVVSGSFRKHIIAFENALQYCFLSAFQWKGVDKTLSLLFVFAPSKKWSGKGIFRHLSKITWKYMKISYISSKENDEKEKGVFHSFNKSSLSTLMLRIQWIKETPWRLQCIGLVREADIKEANNSHLSVYISACLPTSIYLPLMHHYHLSNYRLQYILWRMWIRHYGINKRRALGCYRSCPGEKWKWKNPGGGPCHSKNVAWVWLGRGQ